MAVGGADLDLLYQDSVNLVIKGLEAKLYGVSTTCTIINLSSNEFEGVIPESIGNLHALLLLNISHNQLSGRIPSTLRNLYKIETLDLSWNHLQGEIPRELASLTFL
jgi:Leucine-rich repeat (LRR) protein